MVIFNPMRETEQEILCTSILAPLVLQFTPRFFGVENSSGLLAADETAHWFGAAHRIFTAGAKPRPSTAQFSGAAARNGAVQRSAPILIVGSSRFRRDAQSAEGPSCLRVNRRDKSEAPARHAFGARAESMEYFPAPWVARNNKPPMIARFFSTFTALFIASIP